MSKPLTHFVKSLKEISALKDIIVHEDGLSYHEVFYKTNRHTPISHIGAEARKQAREKQMLILSINIQDKNIELENKSHELERLRLRKENIQNAPKKDSIEDLKREEDFILDNLEIQQEKRANLEKQIETLQNFPITHLIIKEYSLDELDNMVAQYRQFLSEKQRLNEDLEIKKEEFQRTSQEFNFYTEQNNQLEEEIVLLKKTRTTTFRRN